MKRYNAIDSGFGPLMDECYEGEYVKYADVKTLLDQLSRAADRDIQLIKANTREQILGPGAHNDQP